MEWAYRELSAIRRLAGTVASEHLTAIMAHDMLTRKDSLIDADKQIANLWEWHGVEETEHKAVAFDVYIAVGGTAQGRRVAMIHSTIFFFKDTFRNLVIMLQNDGKLWSPRVWLSGLNFLFVRPGVLRRMFIPWLKFFRKSFHPWQNDNRTLVEEWQKEEEHTRSAAPAGS
jgi:predicted metal-dependent hydrolase